MTNLEALNRNGGYRRRSARADAGRRYKARTSITELSVTMADGETLRRCECEVGGMHFFKVRSANKKKLYCNNACRQCAYRDRHHQPKPIPYVLSEPCLICGEQQPTTRPLARLYCSGTCRQRAYSQRKATARPSPSQQFSIAAR